MTTSDPDTERSSIDSGEVMFLLMKHRWKIILCTLAGLLAAGILYLNHQPPYESQARLLVRYVLERSPIDVVDSQTAGSSRATDGLIASEVAILSSWDLALEVAQTVGTERLLGQPSSPATLSAAAATIRRGVNVTTSRGSNVITVAFQHYDPEMAVTVLNELLTRYFEKHLSVHRAVGAFDFVVEQKDRVAERLRQTELQLNDLKSRSRVISLADSTSAINDSLLRSQKDLEFAQVEYAEQRARVEALENLVGQSSRPNNPDAPRPTQGELQQYQALVTRLGVLQNESFDLLSRYTPENRLVRMNRDQIARLETQRREMEERYPDLVAVGASAGGGNITSRADLLSERARLAAIGARIEALREQLALAQQRAEQLALVTPAIAQLERRREVEEQNFKYFEATLERTRIDETLDPSKIPNISVVQRPSPAHTVEAPIHKQIAMLAGGGLVAGLGLVFLLGFVFDRSIKRPSELQRKLGLNHLVAIPYARRHDLKALTAQAQAALPAGRSPKDPQIMARARVEQFVQPYCEAICDRLIHYFAMAGKTHKPKLIGITGCNSGAGSSTIAAGLAAALSRTGDGKVLLVDMNPVRSENRYYFGGNHVSSLVELLEPGADKPEPAAENLYLAKASTQVPGSSRVVPTRFHNLLPRLKHSEFDYIVFDMPPANDTSPTLAMAGFVDKVFLVVEAEETNRETARRAYDELLAMRADTALVVNKARHYGPEWLQLES
jgi:polysaccharide biosynthesis transport protein